MENPFITISVQLQDIKLRLDDICNHSPPKQIQIITQEELSKRLGLSVDTIIRWRKKGKIPSLRVGNSVRYNWYSVLDALESIKKK